MASQLSNTILSAFPVCKHAVIPAGSVRSIVPVSGRKSRTGKRTESGSQSDALTTIRHGFMWTRGLLLPGKPQQGKQRNRTPRWNPHHTLTWAMGEPHTGGSHHFIYKGHEWLLPASLAQPNNEECNTRRLTEMTALRVPAAGP